MLDQKEEVKVSDRLDALRAADYGKSVRILNDTYLLKSTCDNLRFGNAYVIKGKNSKNLVLIDAVKREHRDELLRFRESGHNILAIILTSSDLVGQAYTELSDIARELNTQIYIHPMDSAMTHTVDITGYHNFLQEFDLTVFHMPGYTNGSIVIHSGATQALFTGNSAVGSPYERNDYFLNRPILDDQEDDMVLQESWKSICVDFEHILPSRGKPQFDIDFKRKEIIIQQLTKLEQTKTL
ncbi:MAG: MBL fold metallo-hydrolase [Nonlabens sp.]